MSGARVWARSFEGRVAAVALTRASELDRVWAKHGDIIESITVLEDGAVVAHVRAGAPLGAPRKWTLSSQRRVRCMPQPAIQAAHAIDLV